MRFMFVFITNLAETVAMTTNDIIIKILLMACRLLEEKGWTQGSMARDASGGVCAVNSDMADSYCLSGALVKSWRTLDPANEDFYFRFFEACFSDVLLRRYNSTHTLTRWNDDIETHRDAVMELIRAVISSIRSGPTGLSQETVSAAKSGLFAAPGGSRSLPTSREKRIKAAVRFISSRYISIMPPWRPSQQEDMLFGWSM